ncbi:MAG: hypothetical protein MR537_00700 [Clostridiales bacterium]|nr:hypothetical protein [Clostridiales bacterium]
MNQQKGRIAELLPKQSGRELSYIIFFAQIVIIAAILCVTEYSGALKAQIR